VTSFVHLCGSAAAAAAARAALSQMTYAKAGEAVVAAV